MNTTLNLLAVGMFLAALGTGFGQPVITTQPQSQTNAVGTTATFWVEATNSAPLAYQWQKFVAANWSDLPDRTNATLVLTNVQTNNAADYRVAVTNVDGTTHSDVAHLYVIVPATLQFTATSCTVVESAAAVALVVQRVNDTNTVVSVDYATADGTATNRLKHSSANGTLVFGAGETNQTIIVPLLNDGLVGTSNYFRVILSNPTNAVLGTRTNATVSILDSDKGLHFYVPEISVNEDARAVEIKVARGDDGDTSVGVDYATANGTAVAGQDYTTNAGMLVFAPGEVLKSFIVPLLNDALAEPTKTFRATLSNPTGGAVLGTPALITVTTTNTDQVIQFDSANYYADKYVFSYKPNPAVFANDNWHPDEARRELATVLERARGCHVEFIMKDISTVRYQPQRLWEWARIAMDEVQGSAQ